MSFGLYVEFDDGPLLLEIDSFEDLWELKEWLEAEGFDVEWDYEG